MVLLVANTGLRCSEMIALTWSDLNMRTIEVNVFSSCVRSRGGKAKTDSSCRPVPALDLVLYLKTQSVSGSGLKGKIL